MGRGNHKNESQTGGNDEKSISQFSKIMQNYLNCTTTARTASQKINRSRARTDSESAYKGPPQHSLSLSLCLTFVDALHANAKRKWQTNHNVTTATSLPASTSAHKQQLPLSTLASASASASASTSFGAKMKFLFSRLCCCCCCLCWPGEQTKSYANQSTLWQAKVQRTLNFQPTKLGMPHATCHTPRPAPTAFPLATTGGSAHERRHCLPHLRQFLT